MTIAEAALSILAVCALVQTAIQISDWWAIRNYQREPAPPSDLGAATSRLFQEWCDDNPDWGREQQPLPDAAKIRLGARARAERNRSESLLRERSTEVTPGKPVMSGRVGYDLDIGSEHEEYAGRAENDDGDEGGDLEQEQRQG